MSNRPEISGLPERDEAESYYWRYIDRIQDPDVVGVLETQLAPTVAFLRQYDDAGSLYRYQPDKWSVREVVGHLADCERLFLARAFWFARGFSTPLPSFDQNVCATAGEADLVPWDQLIDELTTIRESTLSFFRNLPAEAWTRRGVASDCGFSVRALAYLAAGHVDHHLAVLRERYDAEGGKVRSSDRQQQPA
jgi:hypothetical protein